MHVHLGQRRDQRLLGALIALEQLGREATGPVLRYPQLQDPDPRHQLAIVIARAMPQPICRPLVLLGLKRLGHLRLKHLLNDSLQQRPKSIRVARQHRFPVESSRRSLAIGHGVFPFHGVGDVEHHHHAMAASASKLLQNLQHTISQGIERTRWRGNGVSG